MSVHCPCRQLGLFLLTALAIAGLLAGGSACGSADSSAPEQTLPPGTPGPLPAHGHIELPLPNSAAVTIPGLPMDTQQAAPNRTLSYTNVVSYKGNGIFSTTANTLFPNDSIVLLSSPTELSWAMYGFNTGGYQPEHLSVNLHCEAGSVAYVGFSNYQSKRWEWQAPTPGPAGFELPPALYLSPGNQFYIIVLTAGGSVATVDALSVRFDNDVDYANSISGTLLDEHGAPLAGQPVSVSPNPDFVDILSDVDGSYLIGLPSAGNYTVEPQNFPFQFAPFNRSLDLDGASSGQDFTGTRIDIRGRIATAEDGGVPGVSLTLNPGAIMTTVSGADGLYEFLGVPDGDYTVEPVLVSYSFSPAFTAASVAAADLEGIDFEASGGQPAYGISGNIHLATLEGVAGVLVQLNPGGRLAYTDAFGNYLFSGLAPAQYTLKPYLSQWSFAPLQRTVVLSGASENNADFTATAPPETYKVTGMVTFHDTTEHLHYAIPSVQVILTEKYGLTALYETQTDLGGNYVFPAVVPGRYAVHVLAYGYSTDPLALFYVTFFDKEQDVSTKLIGGPSWDNFGAGFVANACTSCHRPDSQTAALPPLRTYEEVVSAGINCNLRIQEGSMPPGHLLLPIHFRYFELWKESGFKLK